jgi:hypothetical protein
VHTGPPALHTVDISIRLSGQLREIGKCPEIGQVIVGRSRLFSTIADAVSSIGLE